MSFMSAAPHVLRHSPRHAKNGHTGALAATGLAAMLLPLVLSTGTASADPGTPATDVVTAETVQPTTPAAAVAPTTTAVAPVSPAATVDPSTTARTVAPAASRARITELKLSGPLTQGAGQQTIAAGQLFAGAPIAGATVELQIERLDGGWRTITRAATDAHGVARMNYQLGTTTRVRTYFPGDAALEATASESPEVVVAAPARAARPAPAAGSLGQRAVLEAAKHYGARYRYGSTGPSTFDCSGFTGFAYRKVGINLPRTSGQQQKATRQVPVSDMRTGDLVFTWTRGRVSHVGIWDEAIGKMWAATKTGDIVRPQAIFSRNITVGRVA